MSTRIDIENELRQLQSPLAGLAPVNVFTVPHGYFEGLAASVLRTVQGDTILQRLADTEVPKGYFEGLAGNILARIKAQETAQQADEEPLSPLLQSLRGHNVFTVPEGYFEGLGHDIVNQLSQNGPQQEPLSPLLQSLRGHNVFTVPEGYFEGLGHDIVNQLSQNRPEQQPLSPLLQSLRGHNVFTVPEGYFEGLGHDIVNQLSQNGPQQEPLSPLLQSLRGHNVFTVPEGYFEGLGEQIAAGLRPKAKVVSLRSRLVRYAAAAVVAGMMALGVYQYSSDGPPSGTPPVLALTEVQKQGIALSKDEAQFNKELEAVSGEAIVQFLTANGSDVEEALAAAAANDTELPNEEDLMLDDKVLDDFLNGTGKGNNN